MGNNTKGLEKSKEFAYKFKVDPSFGASLSRFNYLKIANSN
jgi:hypothetical protein